MIVGFDAWRKGAGLACGSEVVGERGLEGAAGWGGFDVAAVGESDRSAESGWSEGDSSEVWPVGEDHGGDDGDAEVGFDEAEHRVHLAAFDGDARFDAGLSEGGEGGVAQVIALAEHHEGMMLELAHRDGSGAPGRVGGDSDDEWFA